MSLTDFVLNNNTWFEADCFDILLPNGFLIRATSHQNDLVVGGNTYYATKYGKWERGSTTQDASTKGETSEMELMLQCDESILFPNSASTPMFQRAKLFARSKVTLTIAYMDLGEVIQGTQAQFVGTISVPSQEASRVTFKCSDYSYLMQAAWPRRVFYAGCPFTVFDSNCDLDKASFAVTKTALSGSSGTVIQTSAMGAIGNDSLPYTKGYIVPNSGEAQGFSIGLVQQIDSTHIQLMPFDIPIAVGDTFTMFPGCNGTTDACGNKFSNLVHFGGQPYIPAQDRWATGG
jgi:uncharacterized phage protein (TIGR02218 family)